MYEGHGADQFTKQVRRNRINQRDAILLQIKIFPWERLQVNIKRNLARLSETNGKMHAAVWELGGRKKDAFFRQNQ